MQRKSKFITFILSLIPGLSHLYLGFNDRALTFFMIVVLSITGVVGVAALTGVDQFAAILGMFLPLIWFVALVDAMSLNDKINLAASRGDNLPPGTEVQFGNMTLDNHKIITVAFSIIPGAGHMYLGLLQEGAAIMSLFFFSAFLMGWLRLSVLLFVLPVIWFYSLFDAFQRVGEEPAAASKDERSPLFNWLYQNPVPIGWLLILFGGLILFDKIVAPQLSRQVIQYLQTVIVAGLFIAGGIRLLLGTRLEDEYPEVDHLLLQARDQAQCRLNENAAEEAVENTSDKEDVL